MFSFWKNSVLDDIDAIKDIVYSKNAEIEVLNQRLQELQEQYDKLKSDRGAEFAFNWSKANAISIERLDGNTVVGYCRGRDTEMKEWYLHCDLETHNKLAKEFKEYCNGKQ